VTTPKLVLVDFKKRRLSNTAQIVDGSGALCRCLKDSQGDMRLDASFVTGKLVLMDCPEERSSFTASSRSDCRIVMPRPAGFALCPGSHLPLASSVSIYAAV
jgi:hypothetical protein